MVRRAFQRAVEGWKRNMPLLRRRCSGIPDEEEVRGTGVGAVRAEGWERGV